GPGCAITSPITVNPLPAPITGGSNICVGRTTMLYDATPGGTWSSGATGIATVGSATGLVSGISGGAALISYTGPNGCAVTRTIHVVSLQPITVGHAICAWGDTVMVSNADT